MSDKIKKTDDVVFFVIDSDNERRSFYMSVCQMVRGVRVFGFETGADAVSFSREQIPDASVIAYSLRGNMTGVATVHAIISQSEYAAIAVIADVYTTTLENEILAAGALDCLSMSSRNDSQLYAMKNLVDLARSRRTGSQVSTGITFTAKTTFEIINIKSYGSANCANRCATAAALSAPISNKLLYIRVFSFLYDFFIKCFLNETDIITGIAVDSKRVIICAQLSERSAALMESAVFYFIAERFIETDGSFMVLTLKLDNNLQEELLCKKQELSTSFGAPMGQRIETLKQNLATLGSVYEIYNKFSTNITPVTADVDVAVNETLDKIEILFDKLNNDSESWDTLENKLFTYLAKLCIIMKTHC